MLTMKTPKLVGDTDGLALFVRVQRRFEEQIAIPQRSAQQRPAMGAPIDNRQRCLSNIVVPRPPRGQAFDDQGPSSRKSHSRTYSQTR